MEVFEQYKKLVDECNQLERMINSKESWIYAVKLKPLVNPDLIEELQLELEQLVGSFYEKYCESLKVAMEIESSIEALHDPEARTLMRLRYIERMEWVEIGEVLYCSRTKCYRLHKKALNQFQEINKTLKKHET